MWTYKLVYPPIELSLEEHQLIQFVGLEETSK